jgi:hypothetical protein
MKRFSLPDGTGSLVVAHPAQQPVADPQMVSNAEWRVIRKDA